MARDPDGSLYLIANMCQSTFINGLQIVDLSNDENTEPVLSITFDEPTRGWDVIIPLDPLDLDRPGVVVESFDEAAFDMALESSGDTLQVTRQLRSDDNEPREVSIRFDPARLPPNAAYDAGEIIEDPDEYGCPRGNAKPWREAFELGE